MLNEGSSNANLGSFAAMNSTVLVALDANGNRSDWGFSSFTFVDHILGNNTIVGTTAPKNSLVLLVLRPLSICRAHKSGCSWAMRIRRVPQTDLDFGARPTSFRAG